MTAGSDVQPPARVDDGRGRSEPAGCWPASTEALHDLHDVLLLDLDGVVYVGPDAVPDAPRALALARAAGARLAFVTNNASRTASSVAEHLTRLAVPAGADDVVTSAQAAAALLARQLPAGARVLVIGGEGLLEAVGAQGLTAVASADDDPAAVVQGFAPQVGWAQLLEACVAVRTGVPWIATNPDLTLPTPRGFGPGNGALVDVVRKTTGVEPAVAGKPFRPIMDEAVRRTGARRPLVVGDRLDTDIAGAVTAGLPSLLVLTGISGVHELMAAPVSLRPTYLAGDLGGLSRPAPGCHPVGRDEGVARTGPADVDTTWRCGQVSAQARGRRVEITPSAPVLGTADEALDAVRAVCAAVWGSTAAAVDQHAVDEHAVDQHAVDEQAVDEQAVDEQAVDHQLVEQALDALAAWTAPHGWDR